METREIVTGNGLFQSLIETIDRVSATKATVLVVGESGTGKELIAERLHRHSGRAKGPMIAINCAAIPENLLESELFGHEKGAFTGATGTKIGKFELASGGTLLLDEISEMDLRLQAKLLRAIQEGKIDRIGGRLPVAVDTRVIATTNQDLKEAVRQKKFREDLYYRLNVIRISVPPLRDRMDDVPRLSAHFIKRVAASMGMTREPVLSREALQRLVSYEWPGNVRELENVIERAVITGNRDTIFAQDIALERVSEPKKSDSDIFAGGLTLQQIEKEVILRTLQRHSWNRTHTARELGISIRTLRNKLSEYRQDGTPDRHLFPDFDESGQFLPSVAVAAGEPLGTERTV